MNKAACALLLNLSLILHADDDPKPAPLTWEQVNRGLYILASQRLEAKPKDPAALQLMQLAALRAPSNLDIKRQLEQIAKGESPETGLSLEDDGALLAECLRKTAESLSDEKKEDKAFLYTVASLSRPGSIPPETLAKFPFQLPPEPDTITPDETVAKPEVEETPDLAKVEQDSKWQEDALGLLESVRLPAGTLKGQFPYETLNLINRSAAPLGISIKLDPRLKQIGLPFTESTLGNTTRYAGSKAHALNRDIYYNNFSNAAEVIKYWDYTSRIKYKIEGKTILLTDSKGCGREDVAEFIYNASTLDEMRKDFLKLQQKQMLGNMVQVRGTLTSIEVNDQEVTLTLNNFLKTTRPVDMFKGGLAGVEKLKKAKYSIVLRGRLCGRDSQSLELTEVVDVLDDTTPYFFTR
ncbi:MAG: hypothetical protein RL095_687 [Verrucomicrobiota bacterium]|jgi:hypothetical protein